MLIDLGDYKIRFDPKEVRINIDGEMIDVGARREPDNYIEWIMSLSQEERDKLKKEEEFPKDVLVGSLPTHDELETIKKRDKKLSNWIIYHKTTGTRINAVEFMRIVNSQ